MSDDRSIHDLLERAVRDYSPATADPERAVLARARRERRRSVLLTVAATLAVVLGGAGMLNVVDTRTRGDGPAAGPGQRSAAWESGQPEDALGRDTAVDAGNGLLVGLPADPLVITPPGWTEFPPNDEENQLDVGDLACPTTANMVYRLTISRPGLDDVERPCDGEVVAPYIWERSGSPPTAGTGSLITQTVLVDDSFLWSWGQGGFGGGKLPYSPFVGVFVPASGHSVTAFGVPTEELLTYLEPAETEPTQFRVPYAEPDLSVQVVRAGRCCNVQAVSDPELADLLTELENVASSEEQPCRSINNQYQIEFRIASSPTALIVVDNVDGCATAVSSLGGGAARVSPGLVPMLVGLSLEG